MDIGDKVRIKTKDIFYEGTLMPNETENIVLKLDNGYNIGIDPKKIISKEVITKSNKESSNKEKLKSEKTIQSINSNKALPKILILHTGGTIASKVDYKTGAVIPRFEPEEIISMFPELRDIANIESELICNILSENLSFNHIEKFAQTILEKIKKEKDLKGIILTHGTDVMTYTSSALGFILQGINIPIIMVGAQRSSDRGSSDAAMNLICAAEFIKKTDFKGVAICMHETSEDKNCLILNCYKTRKMHSSRRDAFRPINTKPIAKVDFKTKQIEFVQKNQYKNINEFNPQINLEKSVGIIKAYPNMNPKLFDAFSGYKGLIVEGTALGHAPIMDVDEYSKDNKKIKESIRILIDSETLVFMTSQSIYGSVQMHVYSCGVELTNMGVSPARMLTETAYIKLAWLLGNYWKSKKDNTRIIELMQTNIDGEIFDRIEEDTYLI